VNSAEQRWRRPRSPPCPSLVPLIRVQSRAGSLPTPTGRSVSRHLGCCLEKKQRVQARPASWRPQDPPRCHITANTSNATAPTPPFACRVRASSRAHSSPAAVPCPLLLVCVVVWRQRVPPRGGIRRAFSLHPTRIPCSVPTAASLAGCARAWAAVRAGSGGAYLVGVRGRDDATDEKEGKKESEGKSERQRKLKWQNRGRTTADSQRRHSASTGRKAAERREWHNTGRIGRNPQPPHRNSNGRTATEQRQKNVQLFFC